MWSAWSQGNALRGHGRNAWPRYSADTFLTVGKCVGVSVRSRLGPFACAPMSRPPWSVCSEVRRCDCDRRKMLAGLKCCSFDYAPRWSSASIANQIVSCGAYPTSARCRKLRTSAVAITAGRQNHRQRKRKWAIAPCSSPIGPLLGEPFRSRSLRVLGAQEFAPHKSTDAGLKRTQFGFLHFPMIGNADMGLVADRLLERFHCSLVTVTPLLLKLLLKSTQRNGDAADNTNRRQAATFAVRAASPATRHNDGIKDKVLFDAS